MKENIQPAWSTGPTNSGALPDNLTQAFAAIVRQYPEKAAVVCGAAALTYSELNARSNRLAHVLWRQRPGDGLIAIYLERSLEIVVALLGALKAGRAYLPIDASYPVDRVRALLDDARPETVVTARALADGLTGWDAGNIFYIEDIPAAVASPGAEMQIQSSPDDVAYVLYTSGSTGKPKGVRITHRNVLRLMTATDPLFHFGPADVWTMFHSFAFDFSVWEMWGPLLTGGKLVIVPFAMSRSPEEFYALLAAENVTVLNQTPSAFQLLVNLEEQKNLADTLPDLRVVIFGGEALRFRALRPWFRRHGETKPRLVNMYGITETTVHVTYRPVRAVDAESEQDSLIGEPIPDLQLHLLDEHRRPVADGEPGEIYVGGAGVALGYLNRPEMTAERFLADPFSGPGTKMYRSGDVAQRRADGELIYIGRADGQVKINGFRIELGEVEAALETVPGITQTCVTMVGEVGEGSRLAAYFVAPGKQLGTHEVSERLQKLLPAQMLPAFYMQLEAMPLTGNGKIDRAGLPVPVAGSRPSSGHVSGSAIEERVAAIWRRVLEANTVEVDDNFFDIGGSSLLLIAVRAGLEQEFARTIPVTWMFECATVRALAARLGESANTGSAKQEAAQDRAAKQRGAFARARAARTGLSSVGTDRSA